MDPYMSILFMLTISFPEAVLLSYFALQLMGAKPKIVEVLLIGILQAIVAYIVRTHVPLAGLHTVLQLLSLVVLITFITRVNLIIASVGIILSVAFYLVQEMLSTQLLFALSGMSVQDVFNHRYMRMLFFVPNIVVMLLAILLIKKYNFTFLRVTGWKTLKDDTNINEYDNLSHKEYLPVLVYVFIPILILFTLNQFFMSVWPKSYSAYNSTPFKLFINGLTVFLAILSLWSLRRTSIIVKKDYEAKKALETIEQLRELILSIRKQRHDFNNHFQVIYGLIEIGNYVEARDYIKNTHKYISGTTELIKTDNPSISALLYSKIIIAETNNIVFNIIIDCSLDAFPLTSNEATSLLGNLIDNAFDAVEKNKADHRDVRLFITSERGEYYIEVANKGLVAADSINKFFDISFTTKSGHSGLGLAIVKEIVEKYKGKLHVTSEELETIFQITIPYGR